MTAESQKALEQEMRRIYREVTAYRKQHGGTPRGMNVLYSPPILRPKLMIVSIQGSAGDRKLPQEKWPCKFSYSEQVHPFGTSLFGAFGRIGLTHVLLCHTVATNIAFPQTDLGFTEWLKTPGAPEWLSKSVGWIEEFIKLMSPAVILTYGKQPFLHLMGREKRTNQTVEQTSKEGIPLIGCNYPLYNNLPDDKHDDAIRRVERLIKDSTTTFPDACNPNQQE